MPPSAVLILGVGNEWRGDDAIGVLLARRLRERAPPGVEVKEHSGEGAGLMEEWVGHDAVIILDAVRSGSPPGTIHRLDASREAIPSRFFHASSHAFSVAEAVELSRALGALPEVVLLYGIEGREFAAGAGLSEEVRMGGAVVLEEVMALIESYAGRLAVKSRTGTGTGSASRS
ncbi:MAG: hydrogenase maturation protease [Candidatus Omnitrophica bacterium]|nr:hydrogenase maturation protease [Candidatus Omnitrophota bacterium]